MADGSFAFNFPSPQVSYLRPGEIVVDLFAGGGGASEALKQALGVDPALAYNHEEWAIGMHAANHPLTIHHREDIWHADPRRTSPAGQSAGSMPRRTARTSARPRAASRAATRRGRSHGSR
ncbi:hypothetical protein FHT13_002888 [Xanthomonas arboricola]|nr:hypothetical protein [Xanthomonas arboricola]MBB3849420.1 hypothetical protein [Xanthomonas arboricola]